MACKRYQDWLMDAALGALAPEREAELRAHAEGCAACRTELDRRQQLVAAMDRAVAASVSAEPSPEFLARIRQRIAEQPTPAPSWFAGWLPVSAGALAVVALLVFWLLPRESRTPEAPGPVAPPVAQEAPATALPPQAPKLATLPSKRHRAESRAVLAVAPAQRREPEVLVPEEYRVGVALLYRVLQERPTQTTALLAEVNAQLQAERTPIAVGELNVPALKLEPLPPVSSPASSETQR